MEILRDKKTIEANHQGGRVIKTEEFLLSDDMRRVNVIFEDNKLYSIQLGSYQPIDGDDFIAMLLSIKKTSPEIYKKIIKDID